MALPVFVFVLLTLAFWILALRTQEMVQCCLINAADSMALQCYTQADIERVSQKTRGVIINETNSGDMNEFYNTLEKYNMEAMTNSSGYLSGFVGSDIVDPLDLQSYFYKIWHMYEYVYDGDNPKPMTGSGGASLFKNYLLFEFYKRTDDSFSDSAPMSLVTRKANVNKLLKSYSIENGFDGGIDIYSFDTVNNYITITIRYDIKIPFPMQAIGKFSIAQTVRVRAWGTGD